MKLSIFLIFLFLAISLIPISFLSIFHYNSSETQIIKNTLHNLDSTASLIESQINLEVEKQILVLDLFTSRILLRTSLDNFNNEQKTSDQEQIHKIIDKATASIPDLDSIHILDNNGMVVASTNPLLVNQKYSDNESFSETIDAKIIDFKLEKDLDESELHVQLIAPLFNDDNRKLGYAILLFDANDVFLTNHLAGLGETGEYIIAKRDQNGDALFITPPRDISDETLTHKVPKERLDIPITQALLKNEQVFDDKVDYREEPILSVTKYIEKMDWGLVVKIDKKEAFFPIETMKNFTFIAIGMTATFSILVSVIFSKSISIPINKIRKATKDIVNDKFTKQLSSDGRDEIKELSNDINVMAESLKVQKEHLIKNERLSAIGQITSRIAHDLKNPLASLKVSIEGFQLKHKNDLDDSDMKIFARMERSVARINRQINEVTDFVRNKSLVIEETKLCYLLSEAVDSIQKPDKIRITLPQNDITINCDATKMEAVFINLLNNAIQSMGHEGEITIRLSEDEKNLILEFIDSGTGIPEDEIPKIFDLLFTTKQQGTGLGLVTCKSIIEQHGGLISVKNNPTTFTITLPKTQD